MPPLILLNGPPRCGKDTSAKILRSLIPGAWDFKLSRRLKEMTHGLYGIGANIQGRWHWPAPHDWFEKRKDEPLPEFRGLTPRQAYIHVSEKYVKPVHGEGALGTWLAEEIARNPPAVATVSDSGFRAEAERLVAAFPGEVGLIRIVPTMADGRYLDDPWAGDSRGYIQLADLGVPMAVVESPRGDLPQLRRNLASALAEIMPHE